jgi:hypothetical protein
VRAFVGYDLIYFSNVVRPGNQIDTTLNLTGSPAISPSIPFSGAARPAPIFITSSFWVQGINFGELHLLSPAAGSPSTEAPEPAASKAPSPIVLLAQTWRRPAWRSHATAAEDPTPPYSLREAGCRIRALYLWVEDAENTLRGGTSCLNK